MHFPDSVVLLICNTLFVDPLFGPSRTGHVVSYASASCERLLVELHGLAGVLIGVDEQGNLSV